MVTVTIRIKIEDLFQSVLHPQLCREVYPKQLRHVKHIQMCDKSLARPDWRQQFKSLHFSSDAEVIAAAETWLDGQHSELFLSGLQKLDFGRRSLFPSWSG